MKSQPKRREDYEIPDDDADSTARQEAEQDKMELDKQRELVQSILCNMLQKSNGNVKVAVDLLHAMREATKPENINAVEDNFTQAVRFIMSDMETALFGDFLDD